MPVRKRGSWELLLRRLAWRDSAMQRLQPADAHYASGMMRRLRQAQPAGGGRVGIDRSDA